MNVRTERLLGLAVISLLLVACGSKEDSAAPPSETAPDAAQPAPAEPEPAPVPDEAPAVEAEEPEAAAEPPAPSTPPDAQASEPEDVPEGKVAETIEVFRNAGASGTFFDTSYGYAVFPTIGKAGLGVGGAHGKGQVFVDGQHVGNAKLTQLSIGLQAGGQAFSEIIFFADKRAFNEFSSGNFEFGAKASAVAITAGASAGAGTMGAGAGASATKDAATTGGGYYKGMAVFTVAKGGLMYEAAIGGQKFKYEAL